MTTKFESVFVVTHIAYQKTNPLQPIEGPFSSLCRALLSIVGSVEVFGLPLNGYQNVVISGDWRETRKFQVPGFFGKWLLLKFPTDVILTIAALIRWSIMNRNKKRLVIGIDPLSCLPLWLFKGVLGYTLVFHCVDFNKYRFGNKLIQRMYELADKWASRFSDQTWVICQALKDYKKRQYGIDSYYVPNSVIYERSIYDGGQHSRTGNKMIWAGALMTDRQFDILFGVFSYLQKNIRTDMEFVIIPTRDYDKFNDYIAKYKLNKVKLLEPEGRLEFQRVAARCDVGIALYDNLFGSTEFIEPMKVWDYLLCGLPFIVSSEPSISEPIKKAGVAYFLKPNNQIPDDPSLKTFLSKINLTKKSEACMKIAKRFDIETQVKMRLDSIA